MASIQMPTLATGPAARDGSSATSVSAIALELRTRKRPVVGVGSHDSSRRSRKTMETFDTRPSEEPARWKLVPSLHGEYRWFLFRAPPSQWRK